MDRRGIRVFAISRKLNGISRRLYRARLAREARAGNISRQPGAARLWGYDLTVQYPDRMIWLYQFLEIFGQDCYGVRNLAAAPVVVDVGANIGMFTLQLAWRRPDAQVTAVEPDPQNLQYLRANLKTAGLDRVRVLPVATGRESGRANLAGEASDAKRTTVSADGFVDVVTLASLLPPKVDLLKIDVEGSEEDTILGAGKALGGVSRAVIECHAYRQRPFRISKLIACLESAGFDRFSITSHREYRKEDAALPLYACLLIAWRSGDGRVT